MKNLNQYSIIILVVLISFNISFCAQSFLKNNNVISQNDEQLEDQSILVEQNSNGETREKHKEEFYLKEEGVTALAYDDFLEGTTKFVNNIEYLGSGYQSIYANPSTTKGIDPGFMRYNAFKYEYEENILDSLTADGDYFLPKGVNLKTQTACEISFSSQTMSSSGDYSDSLRASASFKGGFWGMKFHANIEYKSTFEMLEESDQTFIISSAQCAVHSLEVSRYNPPRFSDDLTKAFKYLLKNRQMVAFYQFFEEFGTHATYGVELGAKFGYFYQASTSKLEQMKSSKLSVEVGMSGWGASGSVKTEYQTQSKEAFDGAVSSSRQYSIGAVPDADNDAAKWATQCMDSPMPIKGSYISWPHFLDEFSDNPDNDFTQDEIDTLTALFRRASQQYCPRYLVPKGILDTCQIISYYKIFGKKYNVPQSTVGMNFSKIGGYKEYKWVKPESVQNLQIRKYAIDELGYMFTLVESQNGNYFREGYKLFWKNPNQDEFKELRTDGITDGGVYKPRYVSAGQGLVIICLERGSSGDFRIYKRNYLQYDDWSEIDRKGYDIREMKIDGNGIIIARTRDANICILKDLSSHPECFSEKAYWLSVGEGKAYFGDHDNTYTWYYNKSGFREKYHTNESLRSGCITQEGWGYKSQGDGQLYFTRDIVTPKKIEIVNSDTESTDFQIQKIFCESTGSGPVVVALDNWGQLFYRSPREDNIYV